MKEESLVRLGVWLCLAMVVASYAALTLAGFVWDDHPLVVANLLTDDVANIPRLFFVDLWETAGGFETQSGYYRPFVLLSYTIDRALWGLSAAGHHLHSLGWHLAASLALFALLRQLVTPLQALFGLFLFALHPIQSEAVAWIAARNDPMAAAFVLGSIAVLVPEKRSPRQLLGGYALALGGLFSKESAVFAPLLLLALDLARWGRPRGRGRYLALGGALLTWFAFRTAAGIQSASVPDADHLWQLFVYLPALAAHYTLRVIWPHPLSLGQTLEYLRPSHLELALGWLALLGGGALLLWRGKRLAGAGLAFACLALAPPLLAIAVRGQLGERYLYMPMAGVAIALAAAIPSQRRSLWGLAIVAVPWVLVLQGRIPEWKDEITLWDAAVEDYPSGYTHCGLAHIYNMSGQAELATPLFQEALRDDPPYLEACQRSVRAPLKAGLLAEAEVSADLSAAVCPESLGLLGLQGVVWAERGRFDDACTVIGRPGELEDARLPLVVGVCALHRGDDAAYASLLAAMEQPDQVDAAVRQIMAMGYDTLQQ